MGLLDFLFGQDGQPPNSNQKDAEAQQEIEEEESPTCLSCGATLSNGEISYCITCEQQQIQEEESFFPDIWED